MTAQGLPTCRRSNKKHDFNHLRHVIRQYGISEIVMGLPLRMSGVEGIQAEKVQEFAEELRHRFKLPVHLFDERLTSVEANRVCARPTEHPPPRRGGGPACRRSDSAIVSGVSPVIFLNAQPFIRRGSALHLRSSKLLTSCEP